MVPSGAIKYRPTLPIVLRPRRRRQQRQAQAQGRQKDENTFFHIIPPSKRLVHPSDAPRGYPLAEIYRSVRASKPFSACWTVVRMMPAAMVCRSSCKTAALTPPPLWRHIVELKRALQKVRDLALHGKVHVARHGHERAHHARRGDLHLVKVLGLRVRKIVPEDALQPLRRAAIQVCRG